MTWMSGPSETKGVVASVVAGKCRVRTVDSGWPLLKSPWAR